MQASNIQSNYKAQKSKYFGMEISGYVDVEMEVKGHAMKTSRGVI